MTSRYQADLDKAKKEIKYWEDQQAPLMREEATLERKLHDAEKDLQTAKLEYDDADKYLKRVQGEYSQSKTKIAEVSKKLNTYMHDAAEAQRHLDDERQRDQTKRAA